MAPEAAWLSSWALSAATWAGDNALPLYLVLLALLLGTAWAVWWTLQRHALPQHPQPTQSSRQPDAAIPLLALGLRIAFGFAAIVAGAWVFAELAEALVETRTLGLADQALSDAVRSSVPPAALRVFAVLTRLADTPTLVLLCVGVACALAWRGRRWLALGWVAAVAGNSVLNVTLKHVFERVRPLHDDGLVHADGFSFPSGHSSGSVVAYGMLAYLALRLLPPRWHLPAVLAAVALAFTVGTSRVVLRVHYASDVIAGFASGTAWLAVVVASIELTRWYRGRSRR